MVSIEAEQIAGDLDKDECDELNSPEWKNQKKHIFVLSEAGKPIYSRYFFQFLKLTLSVFEYFFHIFLLKILVCDYANN